MTTKKSEKPSSKKQSAKKGTPEKLKVKRLTVSDLDQDMNAGLMAVGSDTNCQAKSDC